MFRSQQIIIIREYVLCIFMYFNIEIAILD